MVGVKDKYLKYASAGDHYVGRCKICADQNSLEFDVSPLHSEFSSIEISYCISRKKELDMFISYNIYHLTDDTDDGHAKYLSKISFASICHHHEYPAENVHPRSLLRYSTSFRNIHDRIRKFVKPPYPWDKKRETQ